MVPKAPSRRRSCSPGRLVDGLRVIRAGLAPTDRVVISGVQRARPGRKVAVTEGTVTAFPSGVSRGETSTLKMPQCGRRNSAARAAAVAVRLSHFFIERPIFAAAVSVVITLIGLIAYLTLPVDQYPQIAPPTVSVSAVYPGATAEEIAETRGRAAGAADQRHHRTCCTCRPRPRARGACRSR